MHLSFIAENIISNILGSNNTINIVYEPTHSVLDSILFELPYRFYVFNDNKISYKKDNVIGLPSRLYDIYSYNLYITHSIERCASNNLGSIYHIPSILIIDEIKNYKKEDKFIINQKISNITKLFLSEEAYDGMGHPPKSLLIKPGIPTRLSNNSSRYKDIILFDTSIVAQQLKNLLQSHNIGCDMIDIHSNINNIGEILSQYKFCVDFSTNYKYNLLYGLAMGCCPVTLYQNPQISPYIKHINTPHDLVNIVKQYEPVHTDIISTHMSTNYNYDNFTNSIQSVIANISKEVFIQ